jgi:Leucine-rich repeat (LRR) protein
MKINVQLDPENLALIRGNAKFQKLAKNFLKALDIPENQINNWEETHDVEIDTQANLQFSEMSCHIPDDLKIVPQWIYSFKVFDGVCLLRINNQSFWAQAETDGGIELLPDELINLCFTDFSGTKLSFSFERFTQLISLKMSNSMYLTKISFLRNLNQLASLDLSYCYSLTDISPLASLNQLTSLDLSYCRSLADISHLVYLSKLTTLNLSLCDSLACISPLSNLNRLTSLDLSLCVGLTDFSPLANLNQLTSLDLSSCRGLTDLIPLANLKQLKSLELYQCDSLTDISLLANLNKLNLLDISRCFSLTNIRSLRNLTSLVVLKISWLRSLKNIRPLSKLIQLTALDLSRCESLADISPLAKLKNLTSIDLCSCHSLIDITPLAKLNKLRSLNLKSCQLLSDISPLANLNQLNSLNLYECGFLTDINPLANLKQLISLDFSYCRSLTDISPLVNLNQLNSLDFNSCDSLTDINPLTNLKQLNSLSLMMCGSLTDITPLANLKQLNSLDLKSCHSLSDISPLANLKKIISIELSNCDSLSDISPLANLKQLNSLDLHSCRSLADIRPLANLDRLTFINLYHCEFLTDISVLSKIKQLETIKLMGCHRITKYADFKSLDRLRELEIDIHPAIIADILAHCSVARQDWAFVDEKSSDWLTELASALNDSHPAAVDLATSLGTAFPHIPDADLTQQLIKVLQTDPFLGYLPWKCLLAGTLEVSGLNALQTHTSNLPEKDWPSGAIGGLCAITGPLLRQTGGREWLEKLVLNFSGLHDSNPSFLKPVAAPWCLALQLLGKQELLDQWIVRFTDPDDSTALDSVYREFARRAVSQGIDGQARAWCGWIKNPLVRDEVLMEIADLLLQGPLPEAAAEYLFLLSEPNARTRLAGKLADVPGYLTDRGNVHRLLAACGRDAEAVGALLARAGLAEEFHSVDSATLRALAAREAARVAGGIAALTEQETVGLQRLLETQLSAMGKAG